MSYRICNSFAGFLAFVLIMMAGTAVGQSSTPPVSPLHISDSTTDGTTWLKVVSGLNSIAWRNPGGDWRDRNLVLQGTMPWASATISNFDREQILNFDVTELVRRHKSTGSDQLPNAGWIAWLQSGTALGYFYSREYGDVLKRPKLKVTTSTGTVTLNAGADAWMALSAQTPVNNTATAMSVESGSRIALWFDLSGVSGSILSATLTLTSTTTQYGGDTGTIGIQSVDLPQTSLPGPSVPPPDTTAPSPPTAVSGVAASPTQINLTWSPSTDNVAVTSYRVFRDGALVGETALTAFNDNALAADTTYNYRVSALDKAGNISAQSSAATIRTPTAPPVPPTPGQPPIIPETALRVSDSIYSGATWLYMMGGNISVPWKHAGGDWSDAARVLQGPTPWATSTIVDKDVEQVLAFNVTDLVRQHQSALAGRIPNRGWIVKTISGPAIGQYFSRESADSNKRPILRIQTSVQTYTVSAGADAILSTSAQTPGGNAATIMTVGTNERIALWFDLSKITGTVQSATLYMTSTTTQYGGGSALLGIYPVDLTETFTPIPVRTGIGALFPRDEGIERHADILFVERFPNLDMHLRGWWWAGGDPTIQNNRSIVGDTDPQEPNYRPLAPGVKAYKMTIPAGGFGGDFGRWSLWSNLGYEPEELYIRTYARIGTAFDSMGGKFPFGFDGTYIRRNYLAIPINGFYQYLATNPATGRAWIRPDAPTYAGNGGDTSNGTNGWSARGGFIASDCESTTPCSGWTPNPLIAAGYRGLHYYSYWADQPEAKGSIFDWRIGLLGIVPKNTWFVIDSYVKLNSVNADGSGNKDGILRTWINGQLAFEKTDFRVRHWPGNPTGARNIKLDSVWLNFYHGGLLAAVSPMTVYFSNLVVAKSFIGPSGFVVP
ncbi:hypothetical protein LZ012_14330 [Dechloromonas sp. XY25]|uniref:Fibronectin type-III domain-containing protein n=1 Tax=Dechloromonas hankyongensis TaxID=2908002 RepID=A0ABS9K509_9RHOO|nr:disaggregatase related repeat-containing protein [Dechloromonas hankyongensis]MCG2578169.1 hypothetical protein [Dechloromonas hankyongensis]